MEELVILLVTLGINRILINKFMIEFDKKVSTEMMNTLNKMRIELLSTCFNKAFTKSRNLNDM